MKNQTMLAAIFSTTLLAASSAHAVTIAPSVSITENWVYFDAFSNTGEAEYTVTNNSASAIYAFVVGNDAATGSWSDINGWNAREIGAFEWNSASSNINFLGGVDSPVYTNSLGTFDNLFSGFNQAVMYTFNMYNQNGLDTYPDALPIAIGDTVGNFFFTTQMLASPYIALSQNGQIVGAGEAVHVVPVPAAVWLFASGLFGLAGIARRRA